MLLVYLGCVAELARLITKSAALPASPMLEADTQAAGFDRTRSDHRAELTEDYLELIADLIEAVGEARLVDIAARLGVTSATVNAQISRLQREGFVHSEPYRAIFLTEKGAELARTCRRRHHLVLQLLREIGVPDEAAVRDAEGIEHHVSEATRAAIERFLRERARDPRGGAATS